MDLIEQKEGEIRELVNHPWKLHDLLENKIKWNKLCASMDVIGDTQIAIKAYFSLPSFKADDGGYLYIYGLLQAFFLQQDAVNNLSEVLFNNKINWRTEYPELYDLRELRNDSIGHPTNRENDKSFHFISRYTVSEKGFQLLSIVPKGEGKKFKKIDLNLLRKNQESSIIQILDKAILLMKEEYKNHIDQFANSKISNLIPGTMNYYLGKLYDTINDDIQMFNALFPLVKDPIQKVKEEVIKRYGKISALSGLNELMRRIDYILFRLESWANFEPPSHKGDTEIFLDSLSDRLDELEEMLKEIDEEFS